MRLDRISSYFDDTVIDVLRDSDQCWQKRKVKGQLKISDDFISIFNRPTRRRMLLLSPTEHKKLNGSVIRLPQTGEIYLVGNPQQDIGKGGSYRVTMPLNKITALVEVFEKKPLGITSNPGSISRISRGEFYMDLELRTLSEDGDTINSVFSKYFFWFPKNITFDVGEEFYHDGKTFRVLESFLDTGFRGLRVTTEDDSREPLIYRNMTGDAVYDNVTGEYTTPYEDMEFSAEVREETTTRKENGSLYEEKIYTVLIEKGHLGVDPNVNGLITIDGDDKRIIAITKHRHDKSWELKCQ